MKVKVTVTYISDDNREFDDSKECWKHEQRVKNGDIVIHDKDDQCLGVSTCGGCWPECPAYK